VADIDVFREDVKRDELDVDEGELVADAKIFVGLDTFQDFIVNLALFSHHLGVVFFHRGCSSVSVF